MHLKTMKWLVFIVILCPIVLFGQGFYIKNGATVSVEENFILAVSDSLVNQGTLINNGSLVMGGVWLNTGTYIPGDGRITFNSTSTEQIINHNAQAFSWLTIEGGGVKKFLADIVVERELILNDGIMVAENNSKIIFDSDVIITGGSDVAHVNGAVQHSGAGTKLFPLGNGSVYLPVQLNNLTGSPEVRVSVTELNGSIILPTSSSLNAISDQRYFTVEPVSGSLQNATVTLPVRNEDALGVGNIVIVQSSNLTDPFTNLGPATLTGSLSNGTITSTLAPTEVLLALARADVSGILVYNAIAPNGYEANRYMQIANLPEGSMVTIYNRWGDKVFEMAGYDDTVAGKRFEGVGLDGKELPSGNYFYKIELPDASPLTGFLSLKR
ncbi:MAG: gliding motility-associated C-terminal domain-containing protein [Cyclobacteriaceae bacterium]|nr:MAG: gliding motility-associated C-terminal domain-containing protein [Cyclobacteriaceae bacterium]